MEQKASLPRASSGDPPNGALLVLTATNNSTVPGEQFFNVFPPPLTVTPQQPQVPIPMVSTATVSGTQPVAILKWPSLAALTLIALKPGQSVDTATPTPVTLGSTAAIAWQDDDFSVTVTPGTGNTVALVFAPGIPPSSHVGLVVGPGPILVPIVGEGLTLTPSRVPTFMVQFGTPWQPGSSFSDVSTLTPVSFLGPTAAIGVGSDNVIVQTA